MNEEMESMRINQVWNVVDLPLGHKTIGNKWILKVKRKANGSIERYKACLVAKSFTQQEARNDKQMLVEAKEWLLVNFEMKDVGEEDYVLGIKILMDRSKRLLGMSRENYIKKILERFQMHNCKPCDTLL
ncbi:hypothetical protein CRG98_013526 [Punica granatum]|uniref:Reverse transcriptase Ty1/copia-type domain-containing protein n=1 Tax=Punica granatum TaxID=22663 RepID=A0A2I0KCZ2_PUNGR|nr:hypothetical protein CRG98_013526 [Punica granatum]